jgi:hypothetical protein
MKQLAGGKWLGKSVVFNIALIRNAEINFVKISLISRKNTGIEKISYGPNDALMIGLRREQHIYSVYLYLALICLYSLF